MKHVILSLELLFLFFGLAWASHTDFYSQSVNAPTSLSNPVPGSLPVDINQIRQSVLARIHAKTSLAKKDLTAGPDFNTRYKIYFEGMPMNIDYKKPGIWTDQEVLSLDKAVDNLVVHIFEMNDVIAMNKYFTAKRVKFNLKHFPTVAHAELLTKYQKETGFGDNYINFGLVEVENMPPLRSWVYKTWSILECVSIIKALHQIHFRVKQQQSVDANASVLNILAVDVEAEEFERCPVKIKNSTSLQEPNALSDDAISSEIYLLFNSNVDSAVDAQSVPKTGFSQMSSVKNVPSQPVLSAVPTTLNLQSVASSTFRNAFAINAAGKYVLMPENEFKLRKQAVYNKLLAAYSHSLDLDQATTLFLWNVDITSPHHFRTFNPEWWNIYELIDLERTVDFITFQWATSIPKTDIVQRSAVIYRFLVQLYIDATGDLSARSVNWSRVSVLSFLSRGTILKTSKWTAAELDLLEPEMLKIKMVKIPSARDDYEYCFETGMSVFFKCFRLNQVLLSLANSKLGKIHAIIPWRQLSLGSAPILSSPDPVLWTTNDRSELIKYIMEADWSR